MKWQRISWRKVDCSIKEIAVVWYMVFAAVVLAFMVAYAAMFGFDKLKEALGQIHK